MVRKILGTLNQKSTAAIEHPRVGKNAPLKDLLSKGFITTLTNPKVLPAICRTQRGASNSIISGFGLVPMRWSLS